MQVISISSAVVADWPEAFLDLFAVSDTGTSAGVDLASPDCIAFSGVDRDADPVEGIELGQSPVLLRVIMAAMLPLFLVGFAALACWGLPGWVLRVVAGKAVSGEEGGHIARMISSLLVAKKVDGEEQDASTDCQSGVGTTGPSTVLDGRQSFGRGMGQVQTSAAAQLAMGPLQSPKPLANLRSSPSFRSTNPALAALQ